MTTTRAVKNEPVHPLTPALSPEAGERKIDSSPLSPASGERAGVRGLRAYVATRLISARAKWTLRARVFAALAGVGLLAQQRSVVLI